jgi:hypothetical protein
MKRHRSRFRRVIFATILAAAAAAIAGLGILALRLPGQFQGLKPGDRLPGVRLVSPEGLPVDTSSWCGRPTLLILFNPACPACLNELDNIDALAPTMPGLRVALLSAVSRDTKDTGIATYLDPSGALTRRMRRFAVPAVYWVSSDGRILYARSGARSLADDASIFYALLSTEDGDRTAARKGAPGSPIR